MTNKPSKKYTIYFARQWLEEVLTMCRAFRGFLYHLRTSGHLNSRYTAMDCEVSEMTVENLLRIEVNLAMQMDEKDFYQHWEQLGRMIYLFADEHGDEFNRQYSKKHKTKNVKTEK
jgi:hypothetical protein